MFICKAHYINCIMGELGKSTIIGNPKCNVTAMSKHEILPNHHSVVVQTFVVLLLCQRVKFYITTFRLCKLLEFLSLKKKRTFHSYTGLLNYTGIHISRYIAGSAKCSTKPLSQILPRILSAVKDDLQKNCNARSGVNQMWILKNP